MPPEITRERLNFSMTRKVKWKLLSKKYDRFKRLYIVWLDRNNSEPTGQIERAFSAPIDIPDRFMSFPEDKPWRVELDLEGYARYLKQALREWEIRFKEIRDSRPKGEDEEQAVKLAGPKPQDWRLVVLLSRGDPWCLGFTEKRTPAVEAIIGKAPTRQQIEAERRMPADLRLGAELEALMVQGVQPQFPDEADEQDRELANVDLSVTDQDLEDNDIDPEALIDTDRDDEDELTGDLDLDDEFGEDDIAAELEESVDPAATGGKKVNPRKARTRPGRE